MSHYCEPSIDKTACTVRLQNELKYKLFQMFGEDGECSLKEIIVKICENITKDEILTAESWDNVKKEREANYKKRMLLREKRKSLQMHSFLNPF